MPSPRKAPRKGDILNFLGPNLLLQARAEYARLSRTLDPDLPVLHDALHELFPLHSAPDRVAGWSAPRPRAIIDISRLKLHTDKKYAGLLGERAAKEF